MAKAIRKSKPRATARQALDQDALDKWNDAAREQLAQSDEQSLNLSRMLIFDRLRKGYLTPTMATEELAALPKPQIRRKPKPDENGERAALIKAVRAGSMTPATAAKSLATEPARKPKHTRQGKQMPRVLLVLPGLYPPDGMPPDSVMTAKVHRQVLKEFKDRGWGEVSRDVVERAIGRRKT